MTDKRRGRQQAAFRCVLKLRWGGEDVEGHTRILRQWVVCVWVCLRACMSVCVCVCVCVCGRVLLGWAWRMPMWILAVKEEAPFITSSSVPQTPAHFFLLRLPMTLHPLPIYSSCALPPLFAGNIFKKSEWMHAFQLIHHPPRPIFFSLTSLPRALSPPTLPSLRLLCSVGAVTGVCSDTHSEPRQQAGPCALKGSS